MGNAQDKAEAEPSVFFSQQTEKIEEKCGAKREKKKNSSTCQAYGQELNLFAIVVNNKKIEKMTINTVIILYM